MALVTHSSTHWEFEMKKWIARKLFRMAVRIDITQATEEARILVFVADLMAEAKAPPKKRGRPAGRKAPA